MRLGNYLKCQRVSGLFTFSIFVMLSTISMVAQAAFSDVASGFTSSPYTCPANPSNPQDPANHKMFVVAVNPRPYTPKDTQDLIWEAGTENKDFTFAGNKILTITFESLVDEVNANRNPFFGAGSGSGPANGTYNNGNENTDDAINVRHVNNSEGLKHVLNLKINRNVSKIGYKIQDIDSEGVGVVRYRQRVDVSLNGGIFDNLSFNKSLQDINPANNVITAKRLQECSRGQCVIDASWSYTKANSQVRLKHSNIDTSGISFYTNYIVGYSDFYFCLAPPKIIVNKLLSGGRVDNDDQFRIELRQTDNNALVQGFTTRGSGSNLTDNTSTITTLRDGFSYTVSESIVNGKLVDYNTTYTCSNATTGTDVIFNSGAMITNDTGTLRTFNISGVGYGDEITCNIINKPATYTFSGTVFNDNGGIPDSQANALNANITSGIYANNPKYFDGEFNSTPPNAEAGIFGSFIDLTDCSGTTYKTQAVNADGTYSLKVTTVQTAGNTKVCLVERRNDNNFPVRTTKSNKPLTITADKDIYPDNNFGRVIAANSALVLTKYQHINDCSPNLKYTDIGISPDPTYSPRDGFSTSSISDITPDECIAYKIVATNRANLPITNFVLRDVLQKKGVNNAMATAIRVGPTFNATDYATDSVAIGDNGIVKTNELNLSKKSTREFYFNTKYQSAN